MVQWIIVQFLWFSCPMMSSVQSLLMHFLFYIVNNIRQLNALNPCGLHMESCWVTLCSEVESMLSRWSNWSPTGLHMDSGQKIGWATTQNKMSKVHMESVGEGKVLQQTQKLKPEWNMLKERKQQMIQSMK